MKSLKRSSGRERSWASWPARAWLRRLSQVVRPDVSPPTIDPASADNAGRYAASYIYDYMNFVTVITLTPKCHSSQLPYVCPSVLRSCRFNLVQGVGLRRGPRVNAQESRVVPRSRTPDSSGLPQRGLVSLPRQLSDIG